MALMLSGCGLTQSQRQGVQTFAEATATLGKAGQEEFVLSRKEVVEMNRYRLKLGVSAVDSTKMDGSFTVDRVQVRVDALKALEDYGSLLWQLASKDLNKDFGEAADKFTTSLRSVKGLGLTDEKAGAITTLAASIGGLLIESARADAVRGIVKETSPFVEKLADLVKNSFDADAVSWSLGYNQAIETLRGDLIVAGKTLPAGSGPARDAWAEATAYLARCKLRFDESSRLIKVAAGRLATAEHDLKELLKHEDFSPAALGEYAQTVKQIAQAAKILEK